MINVLVVDGYPLVREGLHRVVSHTGDLVIAGEAVSMEEVLIHVHGGSVDVVVLEMHGGDTCGFQILQRLRDERSDLPVLVVSFLPEEHYGLRVLQLGAAGYVSKAEYPNTIVDAIRMVARGRKYASAYLSQKLMQNL
ncbi:MAG: response regulator transcription factor, partial [Rhodothermales bacterium]